MLNNRTIEMNRVVAGVAWAFTAGLFVVAGVLMVVGHWMAAIFLAEVACGVSAYAAVRHIRVYAARILRRIDELGLDVDMRRVATLPRQPQGTPRP